MGYKTKGEGLSHHKYTFLERELRDVLDSIWDNNRSFITKQDLEFLKKFQNRCDGIEIYRREQCDLVLEGIPLSKQIEAVEAEKAFIVATGKMSWAVYKNNGIFKPIRVGIYRSYVKAEKVRKSIQNG